MTANNMIGAPLRVAELSGPTLQGEGPSIGQPALIVRLAGCHLDCAWCDTPHTWNRERFDHATQSQEMSVSDVVGWVLAHDVNLVVITGGDPLLQRRPLLPLVIRLTKAGKRVEMETNGTAVPGTGLTNLVTRFHVSPKLASSGISVEERIRAPAIRALRNSGKATFTFVVADDNDMAELIDLQNRYKLHPVYVTPPGTTEQAVLAGMRALVAPAITHGWTLAPRLQPLLWG